MDEGGRFEIYCGFTPTVGSNPTLSALRRRSEQQCELGGMTEWTKVLAWKASVRQRTVGSNPTLSATLLAPDGVMAGSSRLKTMNPARPGREQR